MFVIVHKALKDKSINLRAVKTTGRAVAKKMFWILGIFH